MVSESTMKFWGVVALLLMSLAVYSAEVYTSRAAQVQDVEAGESEKVRGNNEVYARLKLALLEMLKESKIHLNNIE